MTRKTIKAIRRLIGAVASIALGCVVGVGALCAFANSRYMDGLEAVALTLLTFAGAMAACWLVLRPFMVKKGGR